MKKKLLIGSICISTLIFGAWVNKEIIDKKDFKAKKNSIEEKLAVPNEYTGDDITISITDENKHGFIDDDTQFFLKSSTENDEYLYTGDFQNSTNKDISRLSYYVDFFDENNVKVDSSTFAFRGFDKKDILPIKISTNVKHKRIEIKLQNMMY